MKRSDYQQCYTYARLKVQKTDDKVDAPFRFAYYYRNKLICHIELVPEEPITKEPKVIKFNAMRKILLSKDHRGKIVIMPIKYIKNGIFKKYEMEDLIKRQSETT